MCHQITYKLPCEHIRADVVYCADAPGVDVSNTSSPRSSSGYESNGQQSSSSKRDSNTSGKKHHRESSSKGKARQLQQHHQEPKLLLRSRSPAPKRKACRNLTMQSIAYPMPPSFEGDPSMAAMSPLLPKCPLPRCPFEALNRCWNCCWCGKGWNQQGRCGCVMIIDGNQVRCEHICCETCTAAGAM